MEFRLLRLRRMAPHQRSLFESQPNLPGEPARFDRHRSAHRLRVVGNRHDANGLRHPPACTLSIACLSSRAGCRASLSQRTRQMDRPELGSRSVLILDHHDPSLRRPLPFTSPVSPFRSPPPCSFLCYLIVGNIAKFAGLHQPLLPSDDADAARPVRWRPGCGPHWARNRLEAWTRSPASLHSFTTRVTLQVLAGNYVLCALTKLIESDGAWIWNSQYMPVQYAKIQAQQLLYDPTESVDLGPRGRR